jgi:hypothetical protein
MEPMTAAIRTLDAKTLSEIALGLCLFGAIVVWIGIRFDRHVFRWAGLSVIVVGLVGLIFQNSLSRQTLAEPTSILPPVVQSPSPSPSPSPTPSPKPKPKPKPTHKKKKAPPPPSSGGSTSTSSGGGGGFTPPPSKPPSQPPLPPVQGSPIPP